MIINQVNRYSPSSQFHNQNKFATDPHRQTQTKAVKEINAKIATYFYVLMNDT